MFIVIDENNSYNSTGDTLEEAYKRHMEEDPDANMSDLTFYEAEVIEVKLSIEQITKTSIKKVG